jgi:hypothetical protein
MNIPAQRTQIIEEIKRVFFGPIISETNPAIKHLKNNMNYVQRITKIKSFY